MKKLLILLLTASPVFAQYAPIVLDPSYEHDKWGTLPQDLVYHFAAYTVSFDSADDNNGDGTPDLWGIPEWVSFEIKTVTEKHSLSARPRWMTDPHLYAAGIAPGDESYAVSGTGQLGEVKTDYRFVRGHLCPKDTAERISRDAAYNTHTLLNAVPQLQWQNNGIWKTIENLCTDWADKYGRVWVVCGPVFFGRNPSMWLGQAGEMPVAIPDALFKIVIREDYADSIKSIAFLIPNILPKEQKNPGQFITTIERIEGLTGLTFLAAFEQDTAAHKQIQGALTDW
ncbi:DNA/RNA non-specific endonuclease [Breznakiella homolactica]|uniref:DNA/RNA non-specific endonuclease n=1 Tax=Breznakiella homolactica TaxID=2798577 RepID=A0A7T7XMB0_9SPIR|nr:DNA/RNA non-specific endonuclease [Breznakiella homolactica]QQO08892.1 DNA/RNA non-specific endonuclease [Breznakiella homolactica]